MGTGKGGEDKLSRIRMTRINLHLGAALVYLCDFLFIADIKSRFYALRIHVVGNRQDIHVSGPFSVSEQRSFHTVGSGKNGKLRCGHAGSLGRYADEC
jgi:hypothetical protein